mgnify:CR=1 FL=1
MTDNASYPSIPHRPNFVDIRTWQVQGEKGNTAAAGTTTTSWQQLYAAGATLENGVQIKSLTSASPRPSTRIGVGGTTADGGFELDAGEEVFIGVRQLSNVWYKASSDAVPIPVLTWRAS